MVPSTLIHDRYRLLELIGRGGMGEVWRAHDESLGRRVAVKCLKPLAQRGDAAFLRVVRERFRREARVAASLQHQGVTVVHDFGDDEGLLYLVMELLEGRNLSQLLEEGKRQPLPVPEVLDVAEQVSAALAYTHAQGVVHRDLKPANVMRTADGTVKICDFGIARLAHDIGFTAKLTGTGIAMGTPHYMSPEQIAGTAVDHRSDLYSFGCVLYELATGAPPFTGGDAWSVLVGHRDAPPEPPRSHRPELPAPLEEAVLWLLSKAPEERPDDAADLSARLAAARACLPAWSAGPAGYVGPMGPADSAGRAIPVSAAVSAGQAAGEPAEWGGAAAREGLAVWEDAAVRDGRWPGGLGTDDARDGEAAAKGPAPGPAPGPGEAASLWMPGWARGMGGGLPAHGLLARRTPPWIRAEPSRLSGQWTGGGAAGPPTTDVALAAAFAVSGGGPRALSAEPRGLTVQPRTPGASSGAAPADPRHLAPDSATPRRPALHPPEPTHPPHATHPSDGAQSSDGAHLPGGARPFGGAQPSSSAHLPGDARPSGSVRPPGAVDPSDAAFPPGGAQPPGGAHLPAGTRPALLAVLASRHSAGESLGRLGCWEEAYEAHAAVAAERHDLLGACHPDTLTSRLAAGHALGRLGRWEEAWEVCRGVALDRARIFGDEHPHTLSAREESAGCLRRLGRATEAVELSRDLVAARTRVSGPAAPATLRALSGLGAALGCLGRWEEALDVYRHVTSLRHRVLGPADPETLAGRNEEAHCLERLGRGEEAARVYRALALQS